MAAKKDLSIEEMMAIARGQKPPSGPAAEKKEEAAAPKEEVPAAEAPAKKAEPKAPAAGGKSAAGMSVEEMLAAARGGKKAESGDAPAKAPAAPKAAAAGGKPASAMSVEEMMAAARAKKGDAAPAAEKPAAAAKAEAPAAKAEKPAAKKAEPGAALDTSSILAAARGARPGPMSKAEAAAKSKGDEGKTKTKLAVPPMPEKPAYALAPAPAAAAGEETRRGFFGTFAAAVAGSYLAVGFTTLTVTNVLWALGGARFMFPNILTEPPTKFKVGYPDDYGQGQVETKYIAQYGVWVVRYEYEGKQILYALKTVCTHLGCTPNWLEAEQKFKCPCHGSGFYKDGINFEGPAPRPLERYAIRRADDGQLEIDKSKTFLEEKGEWKDTASFVPV